MVDLVFIPRHTEVKLMQLPGVSVIVDSQNSLFSAHPQLIVFKFKKIDFFLEVQLDSFNCFSFCAYDLYP